MDSGVPPRCAARFRPEKRLAAGGYGAVWLARQLELDRPVALKVLHPEVVEDADALARFQNEARVTAGLRHENIVVVIDHGVEDGVPWIAYELVEGRSLREELTGVPMRISRAVQLARQVARALEEAHRHGVLHRDIKPENLLVPHDGPVKVADFGLARRTDSAARTSAGLIMGTPGYIAPERIRGEPATPAGDVYAVGVLLFEMLTGRLPFPGDNPIAMLERQLRDQAPAPSSLVRTLPPEVDALVLAAMAREPAGRTQSARLLVAAIDRLREELGLDEISASGPAEEALAAARAQRAQTPLPRGATSRTRALSVRTGLPAATTTRVVGSSATRVVTRRPSLTMVGGKARPLALTLFALALILAAVGLRTRAPAPALACSPSFSPSASPWTDPRYRQVEADLETLLARREQRLTAWKDAPSYFATGVPLDQGILKVSRRFTSAAQGDQVDLAGVIAALAKLEDGASSIHPLGVVLGARVAGLQFMVEQSSERNKVILAALEKGEITTPTDFMMFLADLEGRKLPGRVERLLRDAVAKLYRAIELVARNPDPAGAYLPALFEDLRWTGLVLYESGRSVTLERPVVQATEELSDKLARLQGPVATPSGRIAQGMWTWARIGLRTPEGMTSLSETLAAIAVLKVSAPRARPGLDALETRIRSDMEQEARAHGKQLRVGRGP